MSRMGRRRGLVRYDSLAGLAGRATRWLRPRTILYGILLAVGAVVAAWNISGIRPAVIGVTRVIGAPYFVDSGTVRNQFFVRLVNKRSVPAALTLSVRGLPDGASVRGIEAPVAIGPLGEEIRPLIVVEPRSRFTAPFTFQVEASDAAGSFRISRSMEFLGPEPGTGPAQEASPHGSGANNP